MRGGKHTSARARGSRIERRGSARVSERVTERQRRSESARWRERERERETHTHTQINTERERQRHCQMDGQKDNHATMCVRTPRHARSYRGRCDMREIGVEAHARASATGGGNMWQDTGPDLGNDEGNGNVAIDASSNHDDVHTRDHGRRSTRTEETATRWRSSSRPPRASKFAVWSCLSACPCWSLWLLRLPCLRVCFLVCMSGCVCCSWPCPTSLGLCSAMLLFSAAVPVLR